MNFLYAFALHWLHRCIMCHKRIAVTEYMVQWYCIRPTDQAVMHMHCAENAYGAERVVKG